MKNLLSILYFLFCSISSFSQLIVSNDKMNIVYYGVDNPIQFSVNGYDNKKLVLIASCGSLIRKGHQYIWKLCSKECSSVKFSCYFSQGKKSKLLGSVDYRIKYPPTPKIIFGSTPKERENSGHSLGRTVKWQTIEFGPTLRVDIFDFEIKFYVKEYDVEICKVNRDTLRMKNVGKIFSPDIMKEIKKLSDGDMIWIKNLTAYTECDIIELSESSCLVL